MSIAEIYRNASYELQENKKEILKTTKKLFERLELKNIHEYFYVYCYLLWTGYFSETKTYEYSDIDIETEIDSKIENEYSLFTGKGVCRHNAEFLNLLLNTLHLYSKKMDIRLDNHNIKTIMNIERKIGKHLNHQLLDNGLENHEVVFTKDTNGFYIMDPTILCENEIINNGELISFSGSYNINLEIFKTNLQKIEEYCLFNNENYLSKELLIEYYKNAKLICLSNRDLFENFYNQNKEKYTKICKLINYFKIN